MSDESVVLEVGSGRPIAVELTSGRVVAVDWSLGMMEPLRRSQRLAYLIGDAERLPVASEAMDAVVASLGAPFNTDRFWQDARRVTRPGGVVAFTTPSYSWAVCDRNATSIHEETCCTATWVSNNEVLTFTSVVLPDEQQVSLAESAGLHLRHVEHSRRSRSITNRDVPFEVEVSLFIFGV
ncbi:MAG: class I SAM-dependent methyltransferase [Acidimicrobiales bacterium]